MRRLSLLLSVIFALAFVRPVAPVDPRAALQALPLLTEADILGDFAGAFKTPIDSPAGMGGVNACVFNPANNSLIVGLEFDGAGHDTEGYAMEMSIPALLEPSGTTGLFGAVPGVNTSSVIQAYADIINDGMQGTNGPGNDEGSHFGGFRLGAGGALFASIWTYFENGATDYVWWKTESDWSTPPTVTGPYAISAAEQAQTWQNRWMTAIPAQWQSSFGGADTLIGHCCSTTVSHVSYGMNAHAFKTSDIGVTAPVPSTWVLGYDSAHPVLGTDTDSNGSDTGHLWNLATRIGTFVFFKDSATLAYFGVAAISDVASYCYGFATQTMGLHKTCVDTMLSYPACAPENYCFETGTENDNAKTHGPGYIHYFYLYDVNDLVDVYNNVIEPWEVVPYDWGTYYEVGLPNADDGLDFHIEYAICNGYDETNQILYLGHNGGSGGGAYNAGVSFFAFNINTGSTPLIRLRIRIAEMLDRLGFRSPWALATTGRKPIRINQ